MTAARVEPWTARQAAEPQCVVHAGTDPTTLLDALATALRAAGFRIVAAEGGFDATRGISGGYLLSEIAQLPLMTALARVALEVRVLPPDGAGTAVSVTCTAGAGELGAAKRVARALGDAREALVRRGVAVDVGVWLALWQRGAEDAAEPDQEA